MYFSGVKNISLHTVPMSTAASTTSIMNSYTALHDLSILSYSTKPFPRRLLAQMLYTFTSSDVLITEYGLDTTINIPIVLQMYMKMYSCIYKLFASIYTLIQGNTVQYNPDIDILTKRASLAFIYDTGNSVVVRNLKSNLRTSQSQTDLVSISYPGDCIIASNQDIKYPHLISSDTSLLYYTYPEPSDTTATILSTHR